MSKRKAKLDNALVKRTQETEATDAFMYGTGDEGNIFAGLETDIPSASQLIQSGSDEVVFGTFRLTPTGLAGGENASEDEYRALGQLLLQLEGSLQWLIGDWINALDDKAWGRTYQELAEAFGLEVDTLRHHASVAANVKSWIRIHTLSFSHHRIVAKLDEENQQLWLQAADEHNWSVKKLRDALRYSSPGAYLKAADGSDTPATPTSDWARQQQDRLTRQQDTLRNQFDRAKTDEERVALYDAMRLVARTASEHAREMKRQLGK